MKPDNKKLKKSFEYPTKRIGYEGKFQYTLNIGEDEKYNSIDILFDSNISMTLDLLWMNEAKTKQLMRLIESKGEDLSIKDIKEFEKKTLGLK